MKKLPLFSILFAAVFAISAADAPRVSRTLMTTVEKRLDERIQRMWNDNPQALLGPSRGVHLPGYGVVLTAEMNLATANISLMNPTLSEADKVALHKKKLERVPQLRVALKEALVATAASLDPVLATEKVTISMLLPRFSWEDPASVPLQMIVEGTKQQLLAAQKAGGAAIDQAVKITETN
jgi:hypothetical protein